MSHYYNRSVHSRQNPLFSRKELNFRRFNFWWSRRARAELYYRAINNDYGFHRFFINKFIKNYNIKKWKTKDFTNNKIRYKNESIFSQFTKHIYSMPSTKQVFSFNLHIGYSGKIASSTTKKYVDFKKHNFLFINAEYGFSSYKTFLSISSFIRKKKAVYHLVSTRADDRYRKSFRFFNKIYAQKIIAYHTSSKWFGGTLTNILQPTLQQNIKQHWKIGTFDFFNIRPHIFKRKKKVEYKIPDIVVTFESDQESYAHNDCNKITILYVATTDTCINVNKTPLPVYFSYTSDNALHFHNKLLLKSINIKANRKIIVNDKNF